MLSGHKKREIKRKFAINHVKQITKPFHMLKGLPGDSIAATSNQIFRICRKSTIPYPSKKNKTFIWY